MAARLEVERQGLWPPWQGPTLPMNMPPEVQEILTDQEYQATKMEFDRLMEATVLPKRTMYALLFFPIFALVVIGAVTALQSMQAEMSGTGISLLGAAFGAVFIAVALFNAGRRQMRNISTRRQFAYTHFVAHMNASFPHTQWELNQELGPSNISFMVVRTGATLPATVVSVVDAGSTMPVVTAVVVGTAVPAETNENNA